MAAQEFGHLFGKANCWQLTPYDSDGHHSKAVDHRQRARLCFLNGPKFRDLEATALRGAVIKNTLLTEKFTLADFIEKHGPSVCVLFMNHPEKGLMPVGSEADAASIPTGTTIYALVPEEALLAKEEETA